MPSSTLPSKQDLCQQLEQTLLKLKQNPSSITTEDARRLSENYDTHDRRSARIISAVEAFAVANVEVHDQSPSLGQEIHTSLLTIVKDLHAAVSSNPDDVTDEVLKTAQSVVSKEMQKAVGHTNAPHPEVEAELQQELAKIECKIEQGTVTKAEADHLHSLEARAHGHTEKGSITSIAQSVAAKRQRQLSLGAGISPAGSQGLPGLSQEQASRGDGSDARKKTPSVLGDRSNGSCQPSGGNELDAKVADMGPESKSKEKDENVNKKESDRKCCHDDGVDKESHIAAILAKPHAREESQHVFGP